MPPPETGSDAHAHNPPPPATRGQHPGVPGRAVVPRLHPVPAGRGALHRGRRLHRSGCAGRAQPLPGPQSVHRGGGTATWTADRVGGRPRRTGRGDAGLRSAGHRPGGGVPRGGARDPGRAPARGGVRHHSGLDHRLHRPAARLPRPHAPRRDPAGAAHPAERSAPGHCARVHRLLAGPHPPARHRAPVVLVPQRHGPVPAAQHLGRLPGPPLAGHAGRRPGCRGASLHRVAVHAVRPAGRGPEPRGGAARPQAPRHERRPGLAGVLRHPPGQVRDLLRRRACGRVLPGDRHRLPGVRRPAGPPGRVAGRDCRVAA